MDVRVLDVELLRELRQRVARFANGPSQHAGCYRNLLRRHDGSVFQRSPRWATALGLVGAPRRPLPHYCPNPRAALSQSVRSLSDRKRHHRARSSDERGRSWVFVEKDGGAPDTIRADDPSNEIAERRAAGPKSIRTEAGIGPAPKAPVRSRRCAVHRREIAPPIRFERTTLALGKPCSIQLSYGGGSGAEPSNHAG